MKKEVINYSLKNLKQRKARSFLTIFSILVGIATIFIFISFGWGLYDYTESFKSGSSADKLLVLTKGASMPGMDETIKLTDDDLRATERTAGVYGATGLYYDVVRVERKDESLYTFLTSYDPKKPYIMDLFEADPEVGRFLKPGDKGVIAGYNYLIPGKIFDDALGINDIIEVNGEKLKIIGFMENIGNPSDDSQIYVTNDRFLELLPEKDTYAQLIAKVDLENIKKVTENVEKSLRKSRDIEKGKEDFFVQSFEDMIDSYAGALDVIIGFVVLIAFISVIVSAVNTANTMITSVLERYKEIGILKSIGARNSDIFSIFLFESAVLGLIAGGLGTLLGYVLTVFADYVLNSLGWGFLTPHHSPILFLGCIGFAVLTGAISGAIPAIKASKTNTVDALRYE
jgi:putative ABC transport system permease protein